MLKTNRPFVVSGSSLGAEATNVLGYFREVKRHVDRSMAPKVSAPLL
ncbi:MAG: hypothetical protein R3B47_14770 [Bacteroidia bacterium]